MNFILHCSGVDKRGFVCFYSDTQLKAKLQVNTKDRKSECVVKTKCSRDKLDTGYGMRFKVF